LQAISEKRRPACAETMALQISGRHSQGGGFQVGGIRPRLRGL